MVGTRVFAAKLSASVQAVAPGVWRPKSGGCCATPGCSVIKMSRRAGSLCGAPNKCPASICAVIAPSSVIRCSVWVEAHPANPKKRAGLSSRVIQTGPSPVSARSSADGPTRATGPGPMRQISSPFCRASTGLGADCSASSAMPTPFAPCADNQAAAAPISAAIPCGQPAPRAASCIFLATSLSDGVIMRRSRVAVTRAPSHPDRPQRSRRPEAHLGRV